MLLCMRVCVCVCMYVSFSGGFLFFLNYSWHTIEPLYFRIGQDLRDNILELQSLDCFSLSQEFPRGARGEREAEDTRLLVPSLA